MTALSAIRWLAATAVLVPLFAAAAQAAETTGPQLKQGSLYRGQVKPGTQVYYAGKPVRTTAEGSFVIGFGRDTPVNQVFYTQTHSGGRIARRLSLSPRTWLIERINGLDEKHVSPPSEVLSRIGKEARQIKEARLHSTAPPSFLRQGFTLPASGPISGVYGSQRILNGKPSQPHYGLDLAVPEGTPVQAPADGIVVLAQPDTYYAGGLLVIDHGLGVSSSLLHLSKILVKKGQKVTQGTLVAHSGKTGRVSGAHLDWRANWYLTRLDPDLLIKDFPHKAQ
ncbi:MAG: M23 family metallopeptidase [Kistimonas sp.]|nr:M23 family metallopeptidase [Kistimonas sp.]